MSTATLETAKEDFESLIRKVIASGEEIILTEYDRPIARIVPTMTYERRREEYLRKIKSLRGFLKGKVPPFEREPDREL